MNSDNNGQSGHGKSTLYIIGSIVLAILAALILPALLEQETAITIFEALGLGGEVFLRALTMMVVPLVLASVMNGILGMGDVRKLGRPGLTAVLYYVSTTVLAVVVGLIVVNIINPGVGVETSDLQANQGEVAVVDSEDYRQVLDTISEESGLERDKVVKILPQLEQGLGNEESGPSLGTIFGNLLLMLFTDNLFQAAADTNLLPLIVFAIIFAGMLTTMAKRVDTIMEIIEEANEALMAFVMLLMKLAPIGIFCLVSSRFGVAQAKGEFVDLIQQTSWFLLTVLLGLGIHAFATLPLIYWVFTRRNPYLFMRQMSQAILTAFSTASSSATLPVTMDCAHRNAGISRRSTDFVLPLGATINMDGTALYEAAAAIFIAQIYAGADPTFTLTFGKMLIIAVTATLAAIGAAGIPEAGLVTMMIVLNAVGLPLEYVTVVLSIDWLLDRFRTATNTFGDAVGCAVVEQSFAAAEAGD